MERETFEKYEKTKMIKFGVLFGRVGVIWKNLELCLGSVGIID